jgi:hypothetical protein
MPDLSFVSAFANNPITLAILMIGATVIVMVWKGNPFLKGINSKIDTLCASDTQQTADIKDMKDTVKCNTLDVLRMTVYNEGIDIEDRLVAARRYFVRGGNGKVARYVQDLASANPSAWHAIRACTKPEEWELVPEELRSI